MRFTTTTTRTTSMHRAAGLARALPATAALALGVGSANAQSVSVWTGASNNQWISTTNWIGGTPNAASTVAFPAGAANTTIQAPPLTLVSIEALVFSDTQNTAYTLNGLGFGLVSGDLTAESIGETHRINAGIIIADDGTWTLTGQTTLEINGAITESGGSFGIEMIGNDDGVLALNGETTFTGDFVLTSGIARIGHEDALQVSTVVLNGGELDVLTNDIDANIGGLAGAGALDIGSSSFRTGINGADTTFAGPVMGADDSSFEHDGAGTLTITGPGHQFGAIRAFDGTIDFDGASITSDVADSLSLGALGGTVIIRNGADVALPTSGVGNSDTGRIEVNQSGEMIITGAGTMVHGTRAEVGFEFLEDSGVLTISDGAVCDLTSGSGLLAVAIGNHLEPGTALGLVNVNDAELHVSRVVAGSFGDDVGKIRVRGETALFTTENVELGGQVVGDDDGNGLLEILDGATAVTYGDTRFFSSASTLRIDGASYSTGSIHLNGLTPTIEISDPFEGTALTMGTDNSTFAINVPIADASTGGGSILKTGIGTVTMTAESTYTGQTHVAEGTLVLDAPSGSATGRGQVLVSNGAQLRATGTIDGSLRIDETGGTLVIEQGAPGELTVSQLTLSDEALVRMDLGSTTNHDQLHVNNTALFDGELRVRHDGGFTASPGDEFTLFTALHSSGQFHTVEFPDDRSWRLDYLGGAVVLTLTCSPADLNDDGALNVDDVDAFVNAFLAGHLSADFNNDSVLNVDDVDAFVAAFLAGCG